MLHWPKGLVQQTAPLMEGMRGPQERHDRPTVTVKFAQTLDGRIATSSGDGARRISGSESLQFAHQLRAEHQAILVGVQTVIADDPQLTVRLVVGDDPVRIVVDSTARIPLTAKLLNDACPANTVVAHTSRAASDRLAAIQTLGAQTLCVRQSSDGRTDLSTLLHLLRQRGIESLMVEGGAIITTALLRAQLVDRLIVCIAPKIVGSGISSIGDLGIETLSQALTFSSSTFRQVGNDIIVDARLAAIGEGSPASS